MKTLGAYNVKNVAGSIRSVREKLGYSQEYMAVKLHVSQNTYSKIELGYVKLTLDRFFKICQVLEIDPTEIINAEKAA